MERCTSMGTIEESIEGVVGVQGKVRYLKVGSSYRAEIYGCYNDSSFRRRLS